MYCETDRESPPTLTLADVEKRVALVDSIARGRERSAATDAAAHAEEDALYHDVLRVIAAGHPEPAALARAALATAEVGFARWYEAARPRL